MRQVTSPTCPPEPSTTWRRVRRAVVGASVAVAVTLSAAGPAAAENLVDAQSRLRSAIAAVKAEIAEGEHELGAASQALLDAQNALAQAEAALVGVREQLASARARDADLAVELAREQDALRAAHAARARAQADVEAQRTLIAQAARDAYQGQSSLESFGVLVGARTTDEVAQRLQWEETVFVSTADRLAELGVLEQRQAEAERAQADVEARVADAKRAAAANVAEVARLEQASVAQQQRVAALVAQAEGARQAAQTELDADQTAYDALVAEEQAVQGQLVELARQQLAEGRSRADIAALVAQGVVSTNPATYPLVAEGPQLVLSPRGFIRPVKAAPGSAFGMRFHPILKRWRLHNGNDWGAACGVPLYAAQSGVVVAASARGGFGNYVVIDHGVIDGTSVMTGYAHQSRMAVQAGQRVQQGQLIGYVGTTGLSTGCHLHLQVYANGVPVQPMNWIP